MVSEASLSVSLDVVEVLNIHKSGDLTILFQVPDYGSVKNTYLDCVRLPL